jgi:hypothetical protein
MLSSAKGGIMAFSVGAARNFVNGVDLSGTPRGIVAQDAAADAGEVFDKAKAQAQLIGSAVYSFIQGVTPEVRLAISDSALLAQLVANQKCSADASPLTWFAEYSEVLQNVGWTLQEGGWDDYSARGNAVDVHEKILEVMTVALGPAPAALAIVTATINALRGMKSDSPWLTLFSREAQRAKIARFQVGLVEKEEGADVMVSLLACLIEAHHNVTQVLFFKFKEDGARFKARSAKVSINRSALTELGPTINAKVRAYQKDYISSVLTIRSATGAHIG